MLRLDEPAAALAARYHAGDIAEDEVLAHPVLGRWRRSAHLGVQPHAAAHPVGTTSSDLSARRDRMAAIFREEAALLEPMAEELSGGALIAVVADADGVLLVTRGGGDFVNEAARVRLVEGSRWGEDARGTNAIGTALVEGRPIAVVGRAHFEERNQGLFCYATPIRDPYGDLVGVLDVTGAVGHHAASVGLAVQASGAALEHALRGRAYAAATTGGLAVVERMLHRTQGPALLVEASSRVLALNDAARVALGAERLPLDLTTTRIFGVSVAELARAAGRAARFETSSASYEVDVEPIVGAEGRMLSLLVYLSPLTTRPSSPAPVASSAASIRPQRASVATVAPAFDRVLGSDAALVEAKRMAALFAPTDLAVLLLAETGTGKELFARAIHDASKRPGAFVALNCAAITPTLLEAELFGYGPSAFTGAARGGADGKIAAADRGTLFLDEIAEMPDALQATLLRVLEAGEYVRVGEARPRRSSFRLVGATSRDLAALVASGRFRRDLFYRVHGATVTLPPVRARTDRLELARGLLAQLAPPTGDVPARFDVDALAWIEEHDWPGNVRELKAAIAHAWVLSGGTGVLDCASFPRALLSAQAAPVVPARTRSDVLKGAVEEALGAASGNLSEAARRLGVARSTVYRMLKKR